MPKIIVELLEVPECRDEYPEPDDASHSIERAQMLLGRSEDIQGRSVGGISSGIGIKLFPKSADLGRLMIDNWEHPAKKQQIVRLHRPT